MALAPVRKTLDIVHTLQQELIGYRVIPVARLTAFEKYNNDLAVARLQEAILRVQDFDDLREALQDAILLRTSLLRSEGRGDDPYLQRWNEIYSDTTRT